MSKPNNKKPSGSPKSQKVYLRTGSKEFTIIQHLLLGNSLHRFEAEALGDHCLHSTISIIARKYNLVIPRKWVKVSTRFNITTQVKSYWLSTEDKIKINSLR
jgi:hypothetical protein